MPPRDFGSYSRDSYFSILSGAHMMLRFTPARLASALPFSADTSGKA